jgi:mitochondrial fission protein ELM1
METADAPRVWLLIGDKLGDNHQVELIAEHLERRFHWPIVLRQLYFVESARTGKPRFRADASHVDWSRSGALSPPWPDLLLTVGRRPSMVALWIKARSGGTVKIVIVGRPRRWLDRFDLIVAPAHHHVPPLPNVVRLGLPLIVPDGAALAAARAQWEPRFAQMRRPLFALFVGGPTKPHVFDRGVATELMAKVARVVAEANGSLWVTTSPRTSSDVVDAIAAALPECGKLFRWSAGSADNPYLGLLACGDRFIVTGDSVSMQVEVARLGKPLAIYPLPAEYGFVERLRRHAARIAYARTARPWVARLIMRLQSIGLVQFPRDVAEIHQLLIEQGLAVRLGEPFAAPGLGADLGLEHVVTRIHRLLETDAAA